MCQQIAFGKAFQKLTQGIWIQVVSERSNLGKLRLSGILSMHALIVNTTGQVIRGADVELPQHFRLPGSESLWVHGFDIRISKQRQQSQFLCSPDRIAKFLQYSRIEDLAPHNGYRVAQVISYQSL